MEYLSNDFRDLLLYLTPGFLTAWIFFGLTAYPRSSPFERIVQALVFTAIVQTIVIVIRWAVVAIGRNYFVLGTWTDNVGVVWSFLIALALGLGVARCANWDLVHQQLRKYGFTANTSYPSEWFSAFKRKDLFIILNLRCGRRIHGWPEEWPDHPDSGQFVLSHSEWLLKDKSRIPLLQAECLVIPAAQVSYVEFMKPESESKTKEPSDMD
jgi:hypothetical protein